MACRDNQSPWLRLLTGTLVMRQQTQIVDGEKGVIRKGSNIRRHKKHRRPAKLAVARITFAEMPSAFLCGLRLQRIRQAGRASVRRGTGPAVLLQARAAIGAAVA